MRRYLETLHERPVHHRREIAVHAAAGVTGLIFLVWFSTLSVRFLQDSGSATVADSGASTSGLVAATAAAGEAFQAELQSFQPGTVTVDGEGTAPEAAPTEYPVAEPATVIGSPNDPATALDQ